MLTRFTQWTHERVVLLMALFGRGRNRLTNRPGTVRSATSADEEHLTAFVTSRSGVEAYLEPRTTVTETTVVLVAADGEWTRRRIGGQQAAAAFARRHALPLYDAESVGYPRRMRDWTARQKTERRP